VRDPSPRVPGRARPLLFWLRRHSGRRLPRAATTGLPGQEAAVRAPGGAAPGICGFEGRCFPMATRAGPRAPGASGRLDPARRVRDEWPAADAGPLGVGAGPDGTRGSAVLAGSAGARSGASSSKRIGSDSGQRPHPGRSLWLVIPLVISNAAAYWKNSRSISRDIVRTNVSCTNVRFESQMRPTIRFEMADPICPRAASGC
jgi:hypothetical protein